MPHSTGRQRAMRRAPGGRGLVENFREPAAGLRGARALAHVERLAILIAEREARRLLVPQSPAMKAAARHGMYMPPLTCIMLPVM